MVRRNVNALKADIVDPATGVESPGVSLDPLVTNRDLDFWLNSALTNRCVQIFYNAEKALSDEDTIDVYATLTEYELPGEAGIVRSLWWKDPTVPYTINPQTERRKMDFYEGDENFPDVSGRFGVPSYRRVLNFIQLNEVPQEDNPQGILVKYIKWINPLVQDETVIETEFARILQELIVLDAAISAASRHRYLDTSELRKDQTAVEMSLVTLCRISASPTSVRFITNFPIKLETGFSRRRDWRR